MTDRNISSLKLFTGEEHKPFLWEGGEPVALFIHGFMGTPAEFRPLASEFHQQGWTVQGLLLPGFGEQIDTLFERRWSEWTDAVREAIVELRNRHKPLLLVGYSMGAAVAMNVAADTAVNGLALLAPFWRIGTTLQQVIWQIFKRIMPQPKPFKKADFSDPRFHEFFDKTMPELDIADPLVQTVLRQLRVPTRFVDQVFAVGRAAEQAAADVLVPIHIVQGTEDEAVKPERTRQLLQRLHGPVTYEELVTDHGLVEISNPGFDQMTRSVLRYAGRLVAPELQDIADTKL